MPPTPSSVPKDSVHLLALDWGTTNSRVFLVDATGQPVDVRREATGIKNVAEGEFPAAFASLLGSWLADYPDVPIMLCGMVGSRQGWVEAPYVRCPATAAETAAACIRLEVAPGRDATLVPGLSYASDAGVFDVIRGEESQIFGTLAGTDAGAARQLIILPGTHAKWAVVDDGRIERFHTTMTGEVFDTLAHHSILGRLMPDQHAPDDAAFGRGLTRARDRGGLLHHIFAVRAQALAGEELGSSLPSLLSGILIGHEVDGMAQLVEGFTEATLVGSPNMCDLYARALGGAGITCRTVNGDLAASQGLWALSALSGIR